MAGQPRKKKLVNAAGDPVPSVTQVLGIFKNPRPLNIWAYRMARKRGVDLIRAIPGLASIEGIEKACHAALSDFAGSELWDDTKATDAGTIAHKLVEHFIHTHTDGSDDLSFVGEPDAVAKGKAAFRAFLSWKEMTRLEWFKDQDGKPMTEVALVSEKYQYSGQLDAIGLMMDELVIADWKSSNGVYGDHLVQLGAYGELWKENYPDHPLNGGFHLLRFAKENGDFAHHYFPELDDGAAAFIALRSAFGHMKKVELRV